jgi:hypothetical protein
MFGIEWRQAAGDLIGVDELADPEFPRDQFLRGPLSFRRRSGHQ